MSKVGEHRRGRYPPSGFLRRRVVTTLAHMAAADDVDTTPDGQERTLETAPAAASEQSTRVDRAPPRTVLAVLSLTHALVFGWAAKVLPWDEWTAFAIMAGTLAVLHLATAGAALLNHHRLSLVWRLQAAASTLLLGYVGWGVLSSSWYVAHVYSGLGQGLAAALIAVFGLVVLVTAPMALWGWLATGGNGVGMRGGAALMLLVLLGGVRLHIIGRRAAGTALVSASTIAHVGDLLVEVAALQHQRGRAPRSSLMTDRPATCTPTRHHLTLVVTHLLPSNGKTNLSNATECLQSTDVEGLRAPLMALLAKAPGRVKFDLLKTKYQAPAESWLTSLVFRPGLDGACSGGHCLMPWQLAALDMFTSHKLISSVPDARLGVSLVALRHRLKPTVASAPIVRIDTAGWLLRNDGKVYPQGRVPRQPVAITPQEIETAELLARAYILAAQSRTGAFRYKTQPYTGVSSKRGFSVPRQAGTTMVLCQLGRGTQPVRRAVRQSLDLLMSLERRLPSTAGGERSVLIFPKGAKPNAVGLGASALSLTAALRCRPLMGNRYDQQIGRLARMLLSQQRKDGSFQHKVDPREGKPVAALGGLYVDGQAVLALTLLEAAAGEANAAFPASTILREAVERAMEFYGNQYWHIFIRPFLFLEENWHCLAAAASLTHHRHDGYERFCLDYVRFKSRLVLDADAGVSDDFIGGYALGNIVPPHNTATAGFGEALAAAMQVRAARGEHSSDDKRTMRLVVGFLLRNQWRASICFACSPRHIMAGGFSEHMASPNIRIDYVQHAWAAIGHGARAAGWVSDVTAEGGG